MIKKWMIVLFVLANINSISYAIEKAERISDREIIESLATLKEGQKAINQRLDEVKLEIKDVRTEIKDVRTEIKDVRTELKDFMTWGFGVTFAGIFSLIGFVLWDRRNALAPAIRKNKELEEREDKVEKALKEYARQDTRLADILKHAGLL